MAFQVWFGIPTLHVHRHVARQESICSFNLIAGLGSYDAYVLVAADTCCELYSLIRGAI